MKKVTLFLFIAGLSTIRLFPQAVTGVTVNLPYNDMEIGINELWIDTAMSITSTVTPANAANKSVKFTIDSGDACYFVIDTAPGKITCTKAGVVKITAAAQDGSGVTATRRVTVKETQRVNSYRLRFNANNLYIVSDEHYLDPVNHPGEAPPVYRFSMDGDALKIDIDKIGPESAPGSGIPTLTWKIFSYGFSPVVLRVFPSMGVNIDMSEYKNIRVKIRGSNARGHVSTDPNATFKAPDFTMFIGPCTKAVNPTSGAQLIIKGDTATWRRYMFNFNGATGNNNYDSTDVRYLWIKFNNGITYDLNQGWSQTEAAKSNDFKGSVWIEWIAFGKAADTVLVDSIKISGEDSILFVSPLQKFTYTATVYPDDATEKTVFWYTSDENIATIDGSGKLSIKQIGTVKVIAVAQDGSGVKAEKTVKFYYPFKGEQVPGTDYAVYPNPVRDVLHVAGTSDLKRVELLDVSGKVLKTAISNRKDEVLISMSDLSAGVYFLRCYADSGEVITKKVVKE